MELIFFFFIGGENETDIKLWNSNRKLVYLKDPWDYTSPYITREFVTIVILYFSKIKTTALTMQYMSWKGQGNHKRLLLRFDTVLIKNELDWLWKLMMRWIMSWKYAHIEIQSVKKLVQVWLHLLRTWSDDQKK